MNSKELISLLKSPSKEDTELIEKACAFAEKAHEGQRRFSGDPYFIHVFETAKILAELGASETSVAAGLLHDTLEDGGIKTEDIEKEFGREILFLVEGVTKLGKIRYSGAKRHSESLRKLFVAMSQDIRVIIIKLADRLNNMRTLGFVPEHKRERIASETLEIYSQIAYRLGIRKLNRELEDIAFQYVYPEEYKEVKKLVTQKHKENIYRLEKFHNSVRKALAKAGITNIRSNFRIKGLYSLYRKLLRKDKDIEKIYDISALRITVPTINDCYKILGIIHGMWRPLPGRIKDYIAFPKTNGYRSLHTTIFTGDGGIVEVQIKTEEMHRESEYGVASHIYYKDDSGKKPGNIGLSWILSLLPFRRNYNEPHATVPKEVGRIKYSDVPSWVKELVEYQSSHSSAEEFSEELKADFLKERMFVFTPKGDPIDLPIDSTPVDFAFAIHSDIGNHMSGAKVNGKLVSLDTKLKNGDRVEIEVKQTSHPSHKWIEYAKTALAQKLIRLTLDRAKNKTTN